MHISIVGHHGVDLALSAAGLIQGGLPEAIQKYSIFNTQYSTYIEGKIYTEKYGPKTMCRLP